MDLRINRDSESSRDVRSAQSDGQSSVTPASGTGKRNAEPPADVPVDLARRQVEAENLEAASNRVRDPALAVKLANRIRTQLTARAHDAMKVQMASATPQVLRMLTELAEPGN